MLTVKCIECQTDFEAQRSTAKFCSDNCRVKWNYREKNKPPVLDAAKMEDPVYDEPALHFANQRPWIKDIETYCKSMGIEPEQLVADHKKVAQLEKRSRVDEIFAEQLKQTLKK